MADVPEGFVAKVKEIVEDLKPTLDEFDTLLTKNPIIRERCRGVGVLTRERAISYGCSGPVARASGVDFDIRRHDPYSVYDRFQFDVPLGQVGDCYDRYLVRMEEMRQSARILEQAVAGFPEGPYRAKEKPNYKVPAGSYFACVETARGMHCTYMVSENTFKPYRIKSRSPGFSNLAAIHEMSVGGKIADLVAILSTLDLIIPDIDR